MRQMKESGVEWIGCIPSAWDLHPAKYSFEELRTKNTEGIVTKALKFFNGTIIEKDHFDAESDDFVAGTITSYTIVEPDTIMINGLNLNYDLKSLRIGLVREKGVITSAYLALRPDASKILPKYANYLFKGYEAKMAFHNMGAGIRKTLGYKEFKNQPVLYPSIEEQRKIVGFLDNQCTIVDNIIEKTKASIDEYKKLKQAMITQAVTKGVRGDRPMKDSGVSWIREIPSDWSIIPSKYMFCESNIRKQPDDVQLTASQKHGIISQSEYMLLEKAKVVYANKGLDDWKHVEPNDYIISLRSFQGGLELSKVSGCITWHYIVLKARKPINFIYYKWLFKSNCYIAALQRTCNYIRDGQDLRYSNFVQVPLVEPSLTEQREIADYIEDKINEIDELISKKVTLLEVVEDFRKSMIYEYVTGKKEICS